jgi:histidinol-phosphate aminotransferase
MVRDILAEREQLRTNLAALPLVQKIYPSDANFLLVQFEEALPVMQYLLNEKIIVRDRSKVKLCDECLRITVGTAEENRVLVDALKVFAVLA